MEIVLESGEDGVDVIDIKDRLTKEGLGTIIGDESIPEFLVDLSEMGSVRISVDGRYYPITNDGNHKKGIAYNGEASQ